MVLDGKEDLLSSAWIPKFCLLCIPSLLSGFDVWIGIVQRSQVHVDLP